MDRSAIFWVGRLAVGCAGFVLMFGAVRLLGRARAAASWPTAAPVRVVARPLGYLGIGLGILGLATAAALSLGALAGPADPQLAPHTWRAWLVGLGAALVVVGIGAATTGRLVDRAELTALIRTPARQPDAAAIFRSPEFAGTPGSADPPQPGPAKTLHDTGNEPTRGVGFDHPRSPEFAGATEFAGAMGPAGSAGSAGDAEAGRHAGPGWPGANGPAGWSGAAAVIHQPGPPESQSTASAHTERVAQDRPHPGQPELSTSPGGIDPVVPSDGRSGWVYRDPAGDWYLAVATDGGQRLVRLTDFVLVPIGLAGSPLTLEGSVEISVWPATDPDARAS